MFGELLVAYAMAWVIIKGFEAMWGEYTHTRQRYATGLAREHPDWSPRRVHRNARRRARSHWWTEIAAGFPTWKAAWAEDKLVAQLALEKALAAGHKRRADLKQALEDVRAERKAARDAGTEPPAPEPGTGRKWKPTVLPGGREPEPGTAPEPSSREPGTGEPGTTEPEPGTGAAGTTEPEPGTGGEPAVPGDTPARAGARPDDSDWLRPGEERCGLCGGTGRSKDGNDACPACRGFGSAPPDPGAPLAAPGTICGACGRPGGPGDPVVDDPGGPVHRSHAIDQQAAYGAALAEAGKPATPPTATEGTVMTGPQNGQVTDAETGDSPYDAMRSTFAQGAAAAAGMAAHTDDLTAQATAHGFSRDPATMADIAAISDAQAALAAAYANAERGLTGRHADGAEYHGGQDAHASAFRPS